MIVLDAIKAQALKSRIAPDSQSIIRKIFRWYSEKFSTPLHIIDTLPLDFILTHYFEAHFEEMDDQELQEVIVELTESDEEKEARLKLENQEKLSEESFLKAALEEAAKEKAKPTPQGPPQPSTQVVEQQTEELPDISIDFNDNLNKWGEQDPLGLPPTKLPPK